MSKSNYFENKLLLLIFNAQGIPEIADNDQTAPATALPVALHTADPGEAGQLQTTSETAYTGYARQNVTRTAAGWTVTGNVVNPTNNIDFPVCTASPGAAITHFSIGDGAGNILYKGTVTPNITMAVGVIPRLTTGTVVNEE